MSWTIMMRDIYRIILMHLESLREKNKYLIPSLIGGAVVVLLLGLGCLYYLHTTQKEGAAQSVLSECAEEYLKAREGKADWATVELMCRAGYEKYSSTKTAHYFMAYRIDALLALDQREAATSLLKSFIQQLGATSPLIALYQTKLALLELDDSNAAIVQEGLNELRVLAEDAKNKNRDVALYYLAHYYLANEQTDLAQQVFEQLKSLQPADPAAQSPWVAAAEELFGVAQ